MDTAEVAMLKVTEVLPAGTVTVPGAVALPMLDVRLTTVPADPAGPVRVTVPTDAVPPTTELGEMETV